MKPARGEVGEDVLEDGAEVLVDGVHLEQADAAFGVQLVEHVERRDAGDVAGAEHERDRARRDRGCR